METLRFLFKYDDFSRLKNGAMPLVCSTTYISKHCKVISLLDIQSNHFITTVEVQSTLVISTSVISNNRLSRRENLIHVLT